MLRLTIKNVIANKARAALITLAVVIGVSFVSSTFIFSDSLSNTFTQLATDVSAGTDLEVRPVDEFGAAGELTNDTLAEIETLDGVRAVGANVEAEGIAPVAPDGDLIDRFGIGLSWIDDAQINQFNVTDGRPPGAGDFVMSARTANDEGFVVGERYGISTPTGVVDRTLSGLVAFKGGDTIEAQVSFTMVPLEDAQQIFGGDPSLINSLSVSVESNASATRVQAEVSSLLSNQLQVVNQRTIEEEQAADFNSQIAILRNVLLGFAVISLFVSTFIIYNTFGIILSQRVREIGLLRAIGAEGSHIRRSVLGEALLIGLIASVAGLFAGVGLNAALIALLNALGASFPAMETVISARTVLLAFGIGIGVTVMSAMGPARQASRVAPVTAMRGTSERNEHLGRRVTVGVTLVAAGVALASIGLFGATETESVLAAIGFGIAAIFVGITLLSPALARPLINVMGTPLSQLAGASGSLAKGNAARNRRRTANTAAALMIGLSLITTTLVVGQSVKSHLATALDQTVSADFVVSNDFEPLTDEVADRMAGVRELGATLAVSELDVQIADEVREIEATTLSNVDDLFDVSVTSGNVPTADGPNAMLSEAVASELGLGLGDSLVVGFDNGTNNQFEVAALFTDTTLLEAGVILDRETVTQTYPVSTVDWIAAGTADSVRAGDAQVALQAVVDEFPQAQLQTTTEYRETIEAQVDQLLAIVNVMLALSIVIALIGIGLTLALSVFERTREIGLLRAVGMSTRQVRRMIRWEAALIAAFGAVLGVVTGLVYGWGTVTALPDSIATSVSIPSQRLLLLIGVSTVAGLLAAMFPARRAARMNVLDAITGR